MSAAGAPPHDAVVVGAGIAGLTLAYRLRASGLNVLVLDAAPRAGGLIRSVAWEGTLCEAGPSSFLASPPFLALASDLGLSGAIVDPSPAAKRRYVVRGGRLRPVPLSPASFVTSDLLSARAKLRLLLEPFVHGKRPAADESVRSFFERHFGTEVERYLAAPFVSGVYAGDPARLSLRAAFPKLAGVEERSASLFVGMLRRPRPGPASTPGSAAGVAVAAPSAASPGGKPPKRSALRSVGFREGNEQLPRTLAAALGDALRLGAPVAGVAVGSRGLEVTLASGERLRARSVALAVPAGLAASLVPASSKALAGTLRSLPVARVAVVHVLLDAVQLLRALDGFGYLVPREEGIRHLGCIWTSALFPARAPAGKSLLSVYLGGSLDPEAPALPDAALLALVDRELKALRLYAGEPSAMRRDPGPAWIAQYEVGHLERVAEAERLASVVPGLFLGGSSYRGIAVGDCIQQAEALAARMRAYLVG